MAQAKVTDELLDEMLDHLHYEVGQLVLYLRFPNPWVWVLADDLRALTQRSIFEAGLIHLRVLAEFLGNPVSTDGSVVARHYLGDEWPWKMNEQLGSKIGDVHGRLAHLGLVRSADTSFTWGGWLDNNVPAVLAGVRDFLRRLQEVSPARYERFANNRHDGWIIDLDALNADLAEFDHRRRKAQS